MDGEEIEVYSEDFVRRGRGREERVLARTRQSQGRAQIRGLPYIRRRTVGESVGLGLKCGKLGVSVYVCASERRRERKKGGIRWHSLFLCIHLSQVRADIFSSPDRFDQHSTLSPPLLLLLLLLLLSILAVSPICSL